MLNEVLHLSWPQMFTLSHGRVKQGQHNVLGLRARDGIAESTGLCVEAGPRAGWRAGGSGQENRPIRYCQDLRLRRGIDAGLGKTLLFHITQSVVRCL